MSAATKPAKAVRPRVMWRNERTSSSNFMELFAKRRHAYLSELHDPVMPRPVLVLDLAPESVEAVLQHARSNVGNTEGGSHDDTIREVFRALGLVAQRSK